MHVSLTKSISPMLEWLGRASLARLAWEVGCPEKLLHCFKAVSCCENQPMLYTVSATSCEKLASYVYSRVKPANKPEIPHCRLRSASNVLSY
jgi:hypothetical protein